MSTSAVYHVYIFFSDVQHSGPNNRTRAGGKSQPNSTTDQGLETNGGLGDIDIALMRENIGKIRRKKIMKMVEARFVQKFSAVHDMTTLLKDQIAKVAKENAKTSKLITKLCKQVSEFKLVTDEDSDDSRVFDVEEVYDDGEYGTTYAEKRPKLPKLESLKNESVDTNRPTSLPQVFKIQNSETEMFSKSKTNNIKKVAHNKSKGNVKGHQDFNKEKIPSAKASAQSGIKGNTGSSGQHANKRMFKRSAPTENNNSNHTETVKKQSGKQNSVKIPFNLISSDPGKGKVIVSKPPRARPFKPTDVGRQAEDLNSLCKTYTSTTGATICQSARYKSDSSDCSDVSEIYEERNRLKEDRNKTNAKKPIALNTPRRREIEREIRKRERCILQPGRKKQRNVLVVETDESD